MSTPQEAGGRLAMQSLAKVAAQRWIRGPWQSAEDGGSLAAFFRAWQMPSEGTPFMVMPAGPYSSGLQDRLARLHSGAGCRG